VGGDVGIAGAAIGAAQARLGETPGIEQKDEFLEFLARQLARPLRRGEPAELG
jgi:hypothetical protein